MTLDKKSIEDITWWVVNVMHSFNPIGIGNPGAGLTIKTDASDIGWGGYMENSSALGHWSEPEKKWHINVRELKAVIFSLTSLVGNLEGQHFKVMSDNTTTVHSINNMGTCRSIPCNEVVMEIWGWLARTNNWVTATYIPGKENVEADKLSREQELSMEWMLCPKVLQSILTHFGLSPTIDMFASRINKQMDTFVSYGPDPESTYVDAFSLDWGVFPLIYAFPPFACIGRVVRKLINDKANAILITPNWKTQYWYPLLFNNANGHPYFLSPSNKVLRLPSELTLRHPMKRLQLVAWKVFGKRT